MLITIFTRPLLRWPSRAIGIWSPAGLRKYPLEPENQNSHSTQLVAAIIFRLASLFLPPILVFGATSMSSWSIAWVQFSPKTQLYLRLPRYFFPHHRPRPRARWACIRSRKDCESGSGGFTEINLSDDENYGPIGLLDIMSVMNLSRRTFLRLQTA